MLSLCPHVPRVPLSAVLEGFLPGRDAVHTSGGWSLWLWDSGQSPVDSQRCRAPGTGEQGAALYGLQGSGGQEQVGLLGWLDWMPGPGWVMQCLRQAMESGDALGFWEVLLCQEVLVSLSWIPAWSWRQVQHLHVDVGAFLAHPDGQGWP